MMTSSSDELLRSGVEPVIAIDHLRVIRGKRPAVHDLSVQIARGTITGLLGPSGCGKTTLMRCIVGTQIIAVGTVTVSGEAAGSAALLRRVGYMPQDPTIYNGPKLPSLLLPLWDSELGAGLIATIWSLLSGVDIGLVRTFLREVIIEELASRVDDPPGSGIIRAEFVASQLVGVVMARYILELEPFASLPPQQIADTVAPNLQRYLTGELPEWPAP